MNDSSQDAWFYSMEGERLGPVTYGELRMKALDGKLNPRLDMAWTKGMSDWKPAGEIEGLFERRAAPDFVVPEVASDPYRASELEFAPDPLGEKETWPGARRRSYLFMTLLFPALWVSLIVLAANFLNAQLGPEIMGVATPVLMLVPAVFSIYFSVRRYVNLGMSGWWIFGNLVPLLNLWLGYRCFACPAGYAFQKKLDGPGIFLAIVYWLLVAIAVVSLGLMIALLMGSVGSPELQERFREILSKSMGPKP